MEPLTGVCVGNGRECDGAVTPILTFPLRGGRDCSEGSCLEHTPVSLAKGKGFLGKIPYPTPISPLRYDAHLAHEALGGADVAELGLLDVGAAYLVEGRQGSVWRGSAG